MPPKGQSGQSLVEVLVASAVLGIAVVGGITALDAAGFSARQAVRQAEAQCLLRAEATGIRAAAVPTKNPYLAPSGPGYIVTLTITDAAGSSSFPSKLKQFVITYTDTATNWRTSVVVLKAEALAGQKELQDATDMQPIQTACHIQ